jgi:hypothetical protein
VALPGAKGEKLGFFMYPMAENAQGRFDPYAPDDYTRPLQLLARAVAFTDPVTGERRRFESARTLAL